MKNTASDYTRVSSADSASDSEDDAGRALLLETALSRRRMRKFMIILSLLNLVLFLTSNLLFGAWFYNNYLEPNGKCRITSAYSKSRIFP